MDEQHDGRRKWTDEQEQVIRDLYPTLGAKKLAKEMGVDSDRLECKAFQMGVKFQRKVNWTKELVEDLKANYQTEGPKKFAERHGIPVFAVVAKSRRLQVGSTRKLPPKDFEWTRDKIISVKTRYISEGPGKLAKEFGVKKETIYRKASELGLHTIAGHSIAGRQRAERSKSCDIHYFDKLNCNSAWILGFLFADGCVHTPRDGRKHHTLSITLSCKDEYVLDFVKKELKSDLPTYRSRHLSVLRGRQICNLSSSIQIHSTVLVERLMQMGLKPRKTYNNDPFPDCISDEMMPHFIRGFFDGDGTASMYRYRGVDACVIGFIGNRNHITGVRDNLVRLTKMKEAALSEKKQYTINHMVTVTWYAVEDLELFHKFIYPPGDYFFLKRKKDILDKWLSMPHRGSRRPIKWTPAEEELMKEKYIKLGPTKMGDLLNRDRVTVYTKAVQLGLVPHKQYVEVIRKER